MRVDKRRLLACFADGASPWIEIAHRIGIDALETIFALLGGEKIHVPTSASFWGGLYRQVRNAEIRAKFCGDNIHELAQAYGISEWQVRHVLFGKRWRRGRNRKTQP